MVCIFLAEGFEEIEALTVVDILRRADIDIKMVSITDNLIVEGSHKIKVIADCLFEDINYEEVDLLVLPGGMPGTINLHEHKELNELIINYVDREKHVAAICAAPMILGENGLLKGKKATCYPGFEKHLIEANIQNINVVRDGNIITSKGMGVADDFALELVELLKGKEKASQIKKTIIYKGNIE